MGTEIVRGPIAKEIAMRRLHITVAIDTAMEDEKIYPAVAGWVAHIGKVAKVVNFNIGLEGAATSGATSHESDRPPSWTESRQKEAIEALVTWAKKSKGWTMRTLATELDFIYTYLSELRHCAHPLTIRVVRNLLERIALFDPKPIEVIALFEKMMVPKL